MFNLIAYRATFCRNGRLSSDGCGLIQIECSQQRRKVYFSAKVKVRPDQFMCGQVVNHPIADMLNFRIRQIIYDLQSVEIDCMRRNVPPTLSLLKEAVAENSRPTARLVDFGMEFISSSQSRRDATRRSYKTLFNSLNKFRPGALVQDVDYTFVTKYDEWLHRHGSGHNTRVARLRMLRTLAIEAVKRNILTKSPFERFKIPPMTSKRGFLKAEDVKKIENLKLVGAVSNARDAFLFSCYTGLRFSDVKTLSDEHLKNGWITKRMVKTDMDVKIPVNELFDGKAKLMIERYGSINKMVKTIGSNATVNKHLKSIFKMVGMDGKGFTFHTARHSFASQLLQQGVSLSTIQHLLGHAQIATTQIYAEVTQDVIQNDLRKGLRKKKTSDGG